MRLQRSRFLLHDHSGCFRTEQLYQSFGVNASAEVYVLLYQRSRANTDSSAAWECSKENSLSNNKETA
jgi:hypothetical protein